MNALVTRLELNRSRTLFFWLALTIGLYAGTMTAFYPRMAKDVEAVNKMLDLWPKEMLAAFNIEGNLMELGTFYNVYIFTLIWPWIAAIAGILIPTRTLAVDLERGFLELPLGTPISRPRYLVSSIVSQVVFMAGLAVAMIGPIVVAGPLAGVAIETGRFLLVGLVSFAFGCAIAAATTLVSVMTLNRGRAGGVVAGGLLVMYLAQTIAKLAPEISGLSYLSAFRYYSPVPVIRDGAVPFGDLAVFLVLAIGCWVAAVWAFRRRDLVA
jgi:ABC-2 type transport system permease protein